MGVSKEYRQAVAEARKALEKAGNPLVVGLAGPARVGKDTVCRGIGGLVEGGVLRVALADPLRQMVRGLLNALHVDEGEKDEAIPGLGVTPRRLLQTLGTEWGREMIRRDLWVLCALRSLARDLDCPVLRAVSVLQGERPKSPGAVVFTDVRFEDEAQAVRDIGGVVVGLEREGVAPVEAHASERGVEADVTVRLPVVADEGRREEESARAVLEALSDAKV